MCDEKGPKGKLGNGSLSPLAANTHALSVCVKFRKLNEETFEKELCAQRLPNKKL